MKSKPVFLRLANPTYLEASKAAKEDRRKLTDWIRVAVLDALARRQKQQTSQKEQAA